MINLLSRAKTFILVFAAILSIFIVRTFLARYLSPPRLSDLFTVIIILGSLAVSIRWFRSLHPADWVAALVLGGIVGVGMYFATLFNPYPFFNVIRDNPGQAVVRGLTTTIAAVGGLAIMRQGGPVQFHAANRDWRKLAVSSLVGLGLGIPLAVLNVFALRLSEGQPIDWQSPTASLLDALQPGIVEEVVYRFAFLGLLWLVLRRAYPKRAGLLAALLALLVHNYMHFDDLFLQAPLVALGFGLVLAVVWGIPPTILALRRGLESAIAFHWLQDVARFMTGF